jgi:hypothetical protein
MNKRVKALWIEALTSGDYVQGTGSLRKESGIGPTFCCLGVLCDLAVKEEKVNSVKDVSGVTYYDESSSFLPYTVRDWAGLESDSGVLNEKVEYDPQDDEDPDYRDVADSLISLNDGAKFTFAQIAEVIKTQF